MSKDFPEAARPFIDSHIAALAPGQASGSEAANVAAYPVDVSLNDKVVHFVRLNHPSGATSTGVGVLKILAFEGKGHAEIHADNVSRTHGTHYVFTLPESLYKRITTEDGIQYFVEGTISV